VVNYVLRIPAEHCVGQAAKQNQRTCGFVLYWSWANVRETQDLFLTAKITAKTRFPLARAQQTPEEFLLCEGKIFTVPVRSLLTRVCDNRRFSSGQGFSRAASAANQRGFRF
jgi:hypothetical protein